MHRDHENPQQSKECGGCQLRSLLEVAHRHLDQRAAHPGEEGPPNGREASHDDQCVKGLQRRDPNVALVAFPCGHRLLRRLAAAGPIDPTRSHGRGALRDVDQSEDEARDQPALPKLPRPLDDLLDALVTPALVDGLTDDRHRPGRRKVRQKGGCFRPCRALRTAGSRRAFARVVRFTPPRHGAPAGRLRLARVEQRSSPCQQYFLFGVQERERAHPSEHWPLPGTHL
eukprot:scaffold482_cov247-Pinguiococcus_pyrenoidosus.AAC.13